MLVFLQLRIFVSILSGIVIRFMNIMIFMYIAFRLSADVFPDADELVGCPARICRAGAWQMQYVQPSSGNFCAGCPYAVNFVSRHL